MQITRDEGLRLSKAAFRAKMLAELPDTPVQPDDITTLERSPWINHRVDAGWLCLHLFRQKVMEGKRKTDLVGRARNIWASVVTDPRSTDLQAIHSQFAKSHSGLWARAAEAKTDWDDRTIGVYRAEIEDLKQVLADCLNRSTSHHSVGDTVGAAAEVITAHALNEHAALSGRAAMTLPAEAWDDTGHINHGSNFDLTQVEQSSSRKVQVKAGKATADRARSKYDSDIAIVRLDHHLPGYSPEEALQAYLDLEPGDPDFSGVGASMQIAIDRHFT